MVDKSKMKDDLKQLKSIAEDLKSATVQTKDDNWLVDIYEQYNFEHSLITANEFNSSYILSAFPYKNCCLPIPSDSGFFDREEPLYMKLYRGQATKNNSKVNITPSIENGVLI